MPVIPAPTPNAYDFATLVPVRRSQESDRREMGLPGNNEWIGGVFDSAGQFVHESSLLRGKVYPILSGKHFDGDAAYLDEDVIYGGFLYLDHFGHFLIESMSRLWAAVECDRRILFNAPPDVDSISDLNRTYFTAAGITSDRILIPQKPTRFRSITVPVAGTSLGSDTSISEQRELFRKFALSVLGDDIPTRDGRPIYFSRTKFAPRRVHGESHIEEVMRANGYRIVHPETMSLGELIRAVNSTTTFCGVVGSALHNLVFSLEPVKAFYIERTRNTVSTIETFRSLDELMGIDGVYLDVSANILPTFGQRGPFIIDVAKTQDILASSGAIQATMIADQQAIEKEYRHDWTRTYPHLANSVEEPLNIPQQGGEIQTSFRPRNIVRTLAALIGR